MTLVRLSMLAVAAALGYATVQAAPLTSPGITEAPGIQSEQIAAKKQKKAKKAKKQASSSTKGAKKQRSKSAGGDEGGVPQDAD